MASLLRILPLLAAALLCAASAEPAAGERASDFDDCEFSFFDDGYCENDAGLAPCPSGETSCSPTTPRGLYFLGPGVGDGPGAETGDAPLPTVVGGEQTIRVITGSSLASPPFTLPFDAVTGTPAVLTVVSASAPEVRIQGVVPGSSLLRILEPGTGALYDRLTLEVAEVTGIGGVPRRSVTMFDDSDFFEEGAHRFALLAGSTEEIVVGLRSADGHRLADELLVIEIGPPGTVGASQIAWDTVALVAPAPGTISIIARTGGGAMFSLDVRVVDSVDEVTWVPSFFQLDPPEQALMRPGGAYRLCFRAESAGELVAGVDWTFVPSDGLAVAEVERGCATVSSAEPGVRTLRVRAHDRERLFAMEFKALAARAPGLERPVDELAAPAAGDRLAGSH